MSDGGNFLRYDSGGRNRWPVRTGADRIRNQAEREACGHWEIDRDSSSSVQAIRQVRIPQRGVGSAVVAEFALACCGEWRENCLVMGDGETPENEQAWDRLAHARNYRCEQCGNVVPFSERQIYFSRKLCGWCAHMIDKND
jgi:hypothetical protein